MKKTNIFIIVVSCLFSFILAFCLAFSPSTDFTFVSAKTYDSNVTSVNLDSTSCNTYTISVSIPVNVPDISSGTFQSEVLTTTINQGTSSTSIVSYTLTSSSYGGYASFSISGSTLSYGAYNCSQSCVLTYDVVYQSCNTIVCVPSYSLSMTLSSTSVSLNAPNNISYQTQVYQSALANFQNYAVVNYNNSCGSSTNVSSSSSYSLSGYPSFGNNSLIFTATYNGYSVSKSVNVTWFQSGLDFTMSTYSFSFTESYVSSYGSEQVLSDIANNITSITLTSTSNSVSNISLSNTTRTISPSTLLTGSNSYTYTISYSSDGVNYYSSKNITINISTSPFLVVSFNSDLPLFNIDSSVYSSLSNASERLVSLIKPYINLYVVNGLNQTLVPDTDYFNYTFWLSPTLTTGTNSTSLYVGIDNDSALSSTGVSVNYYYGLPQSSSSNDNLSLIALCLAVLSAPLDMIKGIFNFTIFGINLYSLILGLITLALVIWVIKLILGKKGE